MSRNKYPERTVEQIIEIAIKLFSEKGYDNTSIQDIAEKLGMTKGAIYHHFKSKHEILEVVLKKYFESSSQNSRAFLDDSNFPTGKEKISEFLRGTIQKEIDESFLYVLKSQINNPQLTIQIMREIVASSAPIMTAGIKAGNLDGSLKVKFPEQTAEVFLLLINIWLNPVLFSRDEAETKKCVEFMQHLTNSLGLPIIDNEMSEKLSSYFDNFKHRISD